MLSEIKLQHNHEAYFRSIENKEMADSTLRNPWSITVFFFLVKIEFIRHQDI